MVGAIEGGFVNMSTRAAGELPVRPIDNIIEETFRDERFAESLYYMFDVLIQFSCQSALSLSILTHQLLWPMQRKKIRGIEIWDSIFSLGANLLVPSK